MKPASKLLLSVAVCIVWVAAANANASTKSTWVMEGGARLVGDQEQRCLGFKGGATVGKDLWYLPCDTSPGQVFERDGDQIKVGGLCLQAMTNGIDDVIAATCNGSLSQSWVRDSQRVLRAAGSYSCITASGDQPVKLEVCLDHPMQQFQAVSP